MFEELNQHRAAVAEQIQKACEIGFTGNELEKAHKVGDIHPNGKWVWTQLPSGKYDWRVIKKTGAPSGGSAPAAAQKNAQSEKMKEFVNILKQSPYHRDSERQFELMSDSELKKFKDFAYQCSNDKENLNQRTREECAKWSELAKKELEYRGRAQRRHRQTEEYKQASEKKPKISKEEYLKKASKALGAYNGSTHYTSGQTSYGKMDIYVNTYFGKKEYSVHFITADGVDVSRQVNNAMIGNSGIAAKKAVLKYLEENYKED